MSHHSSFLQEKEFQVITQIPFFLVKASHLSLLMWGLTVQATVAVVPPHAVVLQDVQHPGHLAEDEDAGT